MSSHNPNARAVQKSFMAWILVVWLQDGLRGRWLQLRQREEGWEWGRRRRDQRQRWRPRLRRFLRLQLRTGNNAVKTFLIWLGRGRCTYTSCYLDCDVSFEAHRYLVFSKKWANPDLFFIYFRSFQTNNTIFTTNQCEKMSCPSSICRRGLNPWPSERESPPITTRPGLPVT